jgi:thiamine pyrophosphokinase
MAREVVVLTGGDPASPALADRLPADAYVIAADSGLANATALGLHVDLVVGDLDSVEAHTLEQAVAAGADVERHPEAKDRTDLAIALDAAARHVDDADARFTVVGGHGGRLDHLLANALLLAADDYATHAVRAFMGAATVHVVRDRAELHGIRGEHVSLLPLHGPAVGVTTSGLLYPLHDETLEPGSTRGVSNELDTPAAEVRLRAGVLLAVQPGTLGTHARSGLVVTDERTDAP